MLNLNFNKYKFKERRIVVVVNVQLQLLQIVSGEPATGKWVHPAEELH